uniref:PiggyBac transposable element-derived protein domain-containing protein n=1 Tax=Latimeria chalumnae TaxID=7897 RepID=H2ZUM7_LATCH
MAKRFVTVQQALDMVLNMSDDEDPEIVVLPPANTGDVTDEEENDENLNISQPEVLDVAGEVEVHTNKMEASQVEQSEGANAPKKGKTAKSASVKMTYSKPCLFDENYPLLADKSPIELFESLRYANQKLNHSFSLSVSNLEVFLGIILLSGYHTLPQEALYWSQDEDVGLAFISKKMSRNRFQEINRFLHLADNAKLDKSDKLAKIRPFLNIIEHNLQQFGVFSEHLSIDEQMVPYYGHHTTKMYMRGKPVKFGMKVWVLASTERHPFAFDVYTGKDGTRSRKLGKRVLEKLTVILQNVCNHAIYFDNFFSSTTLCRKLSDKGLQCTGTIRMNRTENCPLTEPVLLKKSDRGTYQTFSDGQVVVCQWNDNKPVCVVSNHETVEPLISVRQWSAKKKTLMNLPQPHMIALYNKKCFPA